MLFVFFIKIKVKEKRFEVNEKWKIEVKDEVNDQVDDEVNDEVNETI